jgi:hypothetical protein
LATMWVVTLCSAVGWYTRETRQPSTILSYQEDSSSRLFQTVPTYQIKRNCVTKIAIAWDIGEIKQIREWKKQNWNWVFLHLTCYDRSLPRHGDEALSHMYT